MKTTIKPLKSPSFKTRSRRAVRILGGSIAALLTVSALAPQSARATTYYWDTTTTTTWSTGANWSTTATTGGTTGVVPTSTDVVVFNQSSVNGNETVQLSAAATIAGITFANTGTTLIDSNSATSYALTVGTSGIAVSAGAGAVTIGNATNPTTITLGGAQTWANNSSNTFTVVNNVTNSTYLLTINGSGNTTVSGVIGNGSGGLTYSGTGTLLLSGANTYTGATTVSTGTVKVGSATALGTGTASVTSGAVLDLNGTVMTGTNALTLNGTGIGSGGGLINSGATSGTYAGLITLGSASSIIASTNNIVISNTGTITGATFGLTLGGNAAASSIASIIGTTSGTLTKIGTGTWTLSAANSYTGATTVNAGTLSVTGSLASTSLAMGGGTFTFSKAGTNTQTFATGGTSISAGANSINNTVSTDTLNLGALTRTVGAGVDFTTATGSIITSTANTNSILGGWATFGGTTWAVGNGASAINGLSSYYTTTTGGNTAANYLSTANVDVTSAPTLGGAITVNTLRFNTLAAETLTLTGTNIISSGGILETTTVGSNLSTITGGMLEGASGKDLIVLQNNTSNNLSIGSIIADNTTATGLTKSGAGTLILTGANTYTGNTVVNAGTIQINSGSYTGASTGATSLLLIGNTAGANGTVTIGASAGTLSFGGDGYANAAQVGTNGGTGALTINAGTVNIAGASGQTAALNIGGMTTGGGAGTVTVGGGTLNIGSRILMASNATSTGTLTINSGAVNVGFNVGYSFAGNQPGILRMGAYNSTVNLNGGTLSLYAFQTDATVATNTNINFNGGTLTALGTPNFFLSNAANSAAGTFTTTVNSGGALINTNGFNITIPTNLVAGSPSGGLTKSGVGTLTLSGANTYTGTTAINTGGIALGNASALGGTTAVTIANNAALNPLNVNLTTAATLSLAGTGTGGGGALETGGGAGTTNWNGAITLTGNTLIHADGGTTINIGGSVTLGSNTLTLQNDSGTNTVSGAIGGTGGITANGTTIVLSGTNNYTGATTVAGGTLQLNFSAGTAPATNIISNSSTLVLNGGTLNLTGKASTTNSQAFNLTTINAGASSVVLAPSSTTNLLLSLGAITRNVGGTVNFTQPMGTISAINGITTTNSNTNGILGGWATVGGTDWATNNGSNIVALGSYTQTSVAGTTASNYTNNNIDVNNSAGTLSGVITPSSLHFSTTAANTLALAAGTNTVSSGGILVTSGVGNNLSSITGGTLQGSSAGELFVFQNNPSNSLSIASNIIDNTTASGLTKYGAGQLTLSGTNTYTGVNTIAAGTVDFTTEASLYNNTSASWTAANIIVKRGGTLALGVGVAPQFTTTDVTTLLTNLGGLGGAVATGGLLAGSSIGFDTTNAFGGTFTVANAIANSTGTGGGAIGLTKLGAGTLVLSAVNTYTGNTVISGGSLQISGSGSLGSGTYAGVISGAGSLQYGSSASQTLSAANTYSGGTTISAGTLVISNATSLGTGSVTISGGSAINATGALTYANNIAVNAGVTLKDATTTANTATFSGVLSGAGNISVAASGSNAANTILAFTNTANTFTGSVIGVSGSVNGADYFSFNSLGDGGNFTLQKAGYRGGIIYTGSSNLTFNTRTINIGTGFGGGTNDGNGVPINDFANNGGGTLTFNAAMTMAGVASAGTLMFDGTNAGNNTFAGAIGNPTSGGNLSIGKAGAGTWILSNAANTFAGSITSYGTTTPAGTLAYASALSTDPITVTQTTSTFTLQYIGAGQAMSGAITASALTTGTFTLDGSGSGAINYSNTASLGTAASGIKNLVLTGTNTGANTLAGAWVNNTGAAATLTKSGVGSWTLTGANTYTGATTVNGGTLILNYATNASVVGSTSPLTLGGGTLQLTGNNVGTTNQTLASLSLTLGTGNSIVLNPGAGTSTTLTLSSATVTTGAGAALNFNLSAGTTNASTSTLGTTLVVWSPALTSGIIGGAYTVTDGGGTGFATVSGSNVIRLADPGTAGLALTTGLSSTNYFVTQGYDPTFAGGVAGSLVEALSGPVAANTVTVNTTGLASGANLALGANALTLTAGGGMVFSGANPYTITGTVGITSSATGTITLSNFNTSTGGVTIGAPITNTTATAVTFAGTGKTTLNGANTWTGATAISGGTVQAGSSAALGSTSGLSITNGGTFNLNGYNITIAALSTATGTITDSSSPGSGGLLKINTSLSGGNNTLVTGSVGVAVANTNGANLFTNPANTYSGGTYLGGVAGNARFTPSGIVGTGTPGALTSGILGTGTIFVGSAVTDHGIIYLGSANSTVNNAITYNSQLGTDTGGAVRVDTTGNIFAGTQTAGATGIAISPYSGGNLTITGQITGTGTFTGTTSAGSQPYGVGYAIGTNAGLIIGSSTGNGSGISTVILNNALANNNYTGDTYVTTVGVLQTNAVNQLPSGAGTGNLYLNGTFNMQGNSQATGLLSGSGTIDGVSGTPTLTIGANNATGLTFSGVIKNTAGSLSLTKTGTGTQTLSNTSFYSGATTVSAGTLALSLPAAVPTGPVSLYTFNSGSASDSGTAGPANNGMLNGSPTFVAGISGNAINLNGTSQFVSVPYASSLALSNYTVSFWENLNANYSSGNPTFFATRTGGENTLDIQLKSGGLHADIGTGSAWLSTAADATVALTAGSWNMVTYSVSTTGYSIFVNGLLVGSGAYSGTPALMKAGETLTIGGQGSAGSAVGFFVNALMDEVNIFGSALTQAQVAALYSSTLGGVLPTTTPVTIASGATLDLGGVTQAIVSINDGAPNSGGSVINSAATAPATLVLNPSGGSATFTGTISDTGTAGAVSLIKNGTGTQILAGANTYHGSTTINAGTLTVGANGTLGAGTGALTVNNLNTGAGTNVVLNLATGVPTAVGSLSGVIATPYSGTTNTATINTQTGQAFTVTQTVSGTYPGVIAGGGSFALGSLSNNTLTLSGTNTYTGGTAINGGTLTLDYSTSNSAKIAGTSGLALGGGTLNLNGGSATEIVPSTTLTAGTVSGVTRSSGTSVLQMGTITPGIGATVNFGAPSIATTSTTNTNGILGAWATVGGTDWAINSTNGANGPITAYTGYTTVPRLTPGTIANGSASNVEIIEGSGSTGSILLGAAATTINTLNQSIIGGTSAATIDPAGQTLFTNGILVGTGAGGLTIGTGTNNGTLSAATAGGALIIINSASNPLTINSPIADNSGSSLTLTGSGAVILTGTNTYTGGTTIGTGSLQIAGAGSLGSGTYSPNISDGGTLRYSSSASQTLSGVISGLGALTKDTSSTSTLTLAGANTYTGTTTINAGTVVAQSTSALGAASALLSLGGATLDIQSTPSFNAYNTTVTASSTIASDLAASGAGITYTLGTLSIGAQTLTIAQGANATGTTAGVSFGNTTLTGNATFSPAANTTLNLNGTVGGAFSLTMSGAGNLVFGSATAGALSNSGGLVINNGTVTFSNNNSISGTIPLTVNTPGVLNFNNGQIFGVLNGNGTINENSNFLYTNSSTNGTFSGAINGTGGYIKSGTSTQILSGTNTYGGGTQIQGGVLNFQGAGAFPTGSAVSLGAATFQISNDGAGSGGTISLTGSNITLSGAVTATISTGNNGSANTGNTVAFGALNNGTPAVTYNSTFNLTGSNGYLQSYSSLGLTGGTGGNTVLNPTSTSVTITGNVTNQESGSVSTHYDTLTLSGTSSGNAINGVISDNAGYLSVGNGDTRVTMSGTGTWTLNGLNTYHGPTTITSGTLKVGVSTNGGNTAGPLGVGSALTVTAPGVLNLNGFNITIGSIAASTGIITDTSAAGSGGVLKNTAIDTTAIAGLVTGSIGIQYGNQNAGTVGGNAFSSNTANTYSGGTYLGIGTNGARFTTGATTTGSSYGVGLTSGIFGIGPIYIGAATTDQGQIFVSGAAVINNPVTYNTVLGTDVVGGVRVDSSITFNGVQKAGLSAISYGSYSSANTATVTGQMTGSGTFTGTITGNNGANLGGGTVIGTNAGLIVGASLLQTTTVILNNPSANNNYTGDTYVTAKGILQTNAANQLPSGVGTGNLYLTGPLNMQGNSQSTGGLSGSGTVDGVTAGSTPTLTIGGNNATGLTFGGTIQNTAGSLGLTKNGTGIQMLSGITSTFTGNIIVNGGTLDATQGTPNNTATATALGNATNPSRTITVNTGATLEFDAGNVMSHNFSSNAVPSIIVNGGTLTNGGAATNNALGNLTLNGGTLSAAGGTGSATGYGSWNLNGTVTASGTSSITSAASFPVTLSANGGNGDITTFDVQSGGTLTVSAALGQITGTDATTSGLTKVDNGTLVLSGVNTYTGATAVNGGTLRLDYTTNNTTKLSSTAALTLGGGTLDLKGGSTTEVAASTTLTAGTASSVTSSVPGSTLQMGTITPGTGATVNFGAPSIATTNNINDVTTGILGTWATVGGSDWAINFTNGANGPITAYTGYTTVQRLTPGTITDGSNNVQIIEGSGSTGSITLSAGITTINTLNQSSSGGTSAATIDPAGQQLLTNAILVGTNAGGLTIGTGVNNGTLAAAVAAGNLTLINNSANALTINSVIVNNAGSGLTTTGQGTVTLTAANTYTGATTVSGGTLSLTGSLTGSSVTVNSGGAFNESTAGVIAGGATFTQNSTATSTLAGVNTYNGGTTISAGTLVLGNAAALGSGTLTITGGSLDSSVANLVNANNNAQSWNGNFGFVGSQNLNLGSGAVTLGANSQVTVTANTLEVDGNIGGAFNLAKAGAGTLLLTGTNNYSGGTTLSAGTLQLGSTTAIGTGTLTITGGILDSSVANLVNANNNAQAWNGNFTFAGSQNLNLGTGNVTLGVNTQVTVAANTLTVGGVISGTSGLTEAGGGTLTLTGVNTYSGATIVNAGTLTLSGSGVLYSGVAGYAGAITVASGATLIDNSAINALSNGTTNVGFWTVGGTINVTGSQTTSTPPVINLNNGTLTGNTTPATYGSFFFGQSGGTTINAIGASNTISAPNVGMNAAVTLNTPNPTDSLSISSALGYSTSAAGSLTKTGRGTVTLSGANIYTGTTTVTAGTLTVTGSTNQGTGTSDVLVANSATGNAVLNIQGPMTARYFSVGGVTGASGAVYISPGGSFTGGADIELGFTFGAGATTGGYGYLGMSGGTVTVNRFQFGGQNVATENGVGVGLVSGGTVNAGSYVILARYGTTPGTIGTLTVAGGTLNHTSATANQNIALGWQGAGRAELNLTGGNITSTTGRSVNYGNGTWTGTGIVNLDAGTLTTTSVVSTSGTSYLNFAGGTLKAVSGTTLISPLTGVYINGAFGSFSGGAVVDTNGQSPTISAALIAPSGNGVATIPVSNQGSGYIGAPAVTITDGGSGVGATAIANMVDDGTGNGTFKISSITITNPGNNYTAPVASLVGGGNGVTAATLGTLTSAANTSGGLTKNGTGYLVISGNNTYGGVTTINAGALTLNSAIPNPNTSFVVNSGGQVYGGWAVPGMTFANNVTISGVGFSEGGINVGALRASNNQTFSGPITLAAAAQIGMIEGGSTASTFSGQITGNFALTVQGAFTGSNATQTFTLANTGTASNYTGGISISAVDYGGPFTGGQAIVSLGASNQIPSGVGKGNLALNGADANHLTILELNGKNQTINGLSNAAAAGAIIRNTATGASTLTVGAADATSSFSGVISDGGVGKTLALTKTGAGTLTLSGANTYIGATTVSAGTLALGAAGALGNGTSNTSGVTVSATGAALDLNGTTPTASVALALNGTGVSATGALTNSSGTAATYGGAVTLQTSSSIGGTGDITLSNAVTGGAGVTLTKVSGDTLNINGAVSDGTTVKTNAGTTNVNAAIGTGMAIVDANATTNFTTSQTLGALNIGTVPLAGLGEAPSFSGGVAVGSVVTPEPGSISLLLVGALGLASRRRRCA